MCNKMIKLPYGCVAKIEKEFGASRVTINSALNYETDTKLARKIREKAIELGGEIYEKKN